MPKPLSITKKQGLALSHEIEFGHHIPDVLIGKVAKLENVRYKDELRQFALIYKRRKFIDIADEYELVKDLINNLLNLFLPCDVSKTIERQMRASLAGPFLDKRLRETFIHPFQVFLVGSIIIDKFYDNFRKWYSRSLNANAASSLEASWLLASILHDCGKTSKIIKSELEYAIGSFEAKIPSEDDYIRLMSSFYKHRSKRHPTANWTILSPSDSVLEGILKDSSQRWEHGVKGAALMMKNVCGNPASVTQRDVIAGFSIIVHDKDVWQPMHTGNYLPLKMDLFPLACLLLQLDAAQEWGRHKNVDTEAKLVNISTQDQTIIIEIAFESIKALEDKNTECDKALECVDSGSLGITLDLHIIKRLNR